MDQVQQARGEAQRGSRRTFALRLTDGLHDPNCIRLSSRYGGKVSAWTPQVSSACRAIGGSPRQLSRTRLLFELLHKRSVIDREHVGGGEEVILSCLK